MTSRMEVFNLLSGLLDILIKYDFDIEFESYNYDSPDFVCCVFENDKIKKALAMVLYEFTFATSITNLTVAYNDDCFEYFIRKIKELEESLMKKMYQMKATILNKDNKQEAKNIFVLLSQEEVETIKWMIEEFNLHITIELARSDY